MRILLCSYLSLVFNRALSKEFESVSKRNGQLERTLHDLKQGLEGKESSMSDYLNRLEKSEFDLLNAQRDKVAAEEKVLVFFSLFSF